MKAEIRLSFVTAGTTGGTKKLPPKFPHSPHWNTDYNSDYLFPYPLSPRKQQRFLSQYNRKEKDNPPSSHGIQTAQTINGNRLEERPTNAVRLFTSGSFTASSNEPAGLGNALDFGGYSQRKKILNR